MSLFCSLSCALTALRSVSLFCSLSCALTALRSAVRSSYHFECCGRCRGGWCVVAAFRLISDMVILDAVGLMAASPVAVVVVAAERQQGQAQHGRSGSYSPTMPAILSLTDTSHLVLYRTIEISCSDPSQLSKRPPRLSKPTESAENFTTRNQRRHGT